MYMRLGKRLKGKDRVTGTPHDCSGNIVHVVQVSVLKAAGSVDPDFFPLCLIAMDGLRRPGGMYSRIFQRSFTMGLQWRVHD